MDEQKTEVEAEPKLVQDVDHQTCEFLLDKVYDVLQDVREDIKGKRLSDFTEEDRHEYTKNIRLMGRMLEHAMVYIWHEMEDHVEIQEEI